MAINKVVYNGATLIDVSTDTVKADTLLKGVTAHQADGTQIVGTNSGSGSALDQMLNSLGFDGTNIVFNPDGSIVQTIEDVTKTTVFNADGSITDTVNQAGVLKGRKKSVVDPQGNITISVEIIEAMQDSNGDPILDSQGRDIDGNDMNIYPQK